MFLHVHNTDAVYFQPCLLVIFERNVMPSNNQIIINIMRKHLLINVAGKSQDIDAEHGIYLICFPTIAQLIATEA